MRALKFDCKSRHVRALNDANKKKKREEMVKAEEDGKVKRKERTVNNHWG